MSTITKLVAAVEECQSQIDMDGSQVWVEAKEALEAANAYHQKKMDAMFAAVYGGHM